MFDFSVNNGWQAFFETERQQDYFKKLLVELENEYQNYICFPEKKNIFSAFEFCDLKNVKVVIIGQDPYHGVGEANGLCFSVNNGVKIPPSLKNIFTEIGMEYNSVFAPQSGNLKNWAQQGVLLLNAGLTVRKDLANSHKHLKWGVFTNNAIKYVSENCENIVFLLWGSFAHKKGVNIDSEKHLVLKSGHPSPLSANRGFWFGNNHFKLSNEYLKNNNKTEIDWFL